MPFDPDSYIAEKTKPAGFNPDSYIAGKTQAPVQQVAPQPQQQFTDVPPPEGQEPAQEEQGALDGVRQAIIDNPAGATVAEFGSAVNRGAINLLDFFGPKAINSALELAGVEARIPEIGETELGKAAATGEFMQDGLAKRAVRTAGEFVAPTAAVGQVARTAAAAVPKIAELTTGQRVTQALSQPAAPEAIAGALSGAGREVGGEAGEAIAGETGREVGELVGGVLAPIGGTLAKESGKLLVTKGAKKLLNETAPTIDGLKTAARKVYNELDSFGVTVNSSSVNGLSKQLESLVRKEGFNATIHPKVSAALKEFKSASGSNQSLSEIDILRKITGSAARSTEPDEARLGSLMTNRIDDFLDNLNKANFSTAFNKDVGAKYRDARQLWRRAKKSELIETAFTKAGDQASGFENGIRVQFRSILNNTKKSKGFTKDELAAMREVVRGTNLQNVAKMIGRFGFSEGQASNMLMGSMGVAGGAAVGGPAGAVAVPLVGQISRTLANKLTSKGAKGADIIVRAGNNGLGVVKAYMKAVPAKQRSPQELTELLLRPSISLDKLKQAAKFAPSNQKQLINDAAFLVNSIKSMQSEEETK